MREDDRPIIEPAQPISLLEVLAMLAPCKEEFPPVGGRELDPVKL